MAHESRIDDRLRAMFLNFDEDKQFNTLKRFTDFSRHLKVCYQALTSQQIIGMLMILQEQATAILAEEFENQPLSKADALKKNLAAREGGKDDKKAKA